LEPEIVAQLKRAVRVAKIVEPTLSLNVVKADPGDDRILECAVEGGADLIVSGDRHLTRLSQGIAIVRPIDFLRHSAREIAALSRHLFQKLNVTCTQVLYTEEAHNFIGLKEEFSMVFPARMLDWGAAFYPRKL